MVERRTPLPPGTKAPGFALPRSRHASVSLRDFRGRRVVLAFYPADWEPVSREQLAVYGEYVPVFRDLRAEVIGISTDGIWSRAAFAREIGVRSPLLAGSHPKGATARAYGMYLDGNHRISAACLGGVEMIDAEVTGFLTRTTHLETAA